MSGGVLLEANKTGWVPSKKNNHIYVADLSGLIPAGVGVTGLFTTTAHERMTLARYPNANVEALDISTQRSTCALTPTLTMALFVFLGLECGRPYSAREQ